MLIAALIHFNTQLYTQLANFTNWILRCRAFVFVHLLYTVESLWFCIIDNWSDCWYVCMYVCMYRCWIRNWDQHSNIEWRTLLFSGSRSHTLEPVRRMDFAQKSSSLPRRCVYDDIVSALNILYSPCSLELSWILLYLSLRRYHLL